VKDSALGCLHSYERNAEKIPLELRSQSTLKLVATNDRNAVAHTK